MLCPSEHCAGADPPQRYITNDESVVLGNPAWAAWAEICAYCGCIYTRDDKDTVTIRRP